MKTWMTTITVAVMLIPVRGVLAQTDPPPADSLATIEPAGSTQNVKRFTFTTDVVNREPVDEVDSLDVDASNVFFFTEIVDYEGGSIAHRWIHDGKTMALLTFDIGGPRWRVYSSKKLIPELTGEWTVEVLDARENVIQEATFVYHG